MARIDTNAANYKGYPDPSRIISAHEASNLVGRQDVVFVDTRNYWKYAEGHIPGAVNLELYAFHWIDTSPEGLAAFGRQMAMLFGAFSIDNKKQVIFYQNNSGYDAARGVWMLEWLGSRNGKLLDGGLNLWKREEKPISTQDSDLARAKFTLRVNEGVVCRLDELNRDIKTGGVSVIDVRSEGEFDGRRRRALKAGHVPGAANVEWKKALRRDGTLKSAKQLAAIYHQFPQDAELVTYCQSGYRAAHSWLILKLLGFESVKNYVGSWYEWGSNPSTPAVR